MSGSDLFPFAISRSGLHAGYTCHFVVSRYPTAQHISRSHNISIQLHKKCCRASGALLDVINFAPIMNTNQTPRRRIAFVLSHFISLALSIVIDETEIVYSTKLSINDISHYR